MSGPGPQSGAGVAFADGRYLPLEDASIPVLDRGFVRSDATYDVVHVWKGRFFRLDDHIDRFFGSMSALRMNVPYTAGEIRDILMGCVRRSGLKDAYVQMTCTRGVPPAGTRDPRLCRNRFIAFAQPFVWIANEEQRRAGLKMVVSAVQRIPPSSVDPRIKNFHWLDLTMGIFEAYDRGASVAVLTDGADNITEGAGFNVFIVRDGAVATPDRGVFEGMTRRTIIELCRELGIGCELRPVAADELARADEIFLTSTAGGVMLVAELDGRAVGNGKPGPVATRLSHIYWSRKEAGWLCTPVTYDS